MAGQRGWVNLGGLLFSGLLFGVGMFLRSIVFRVCAFRGSLGGHRRGVGGWHGRARVVGGGLWAGFGGILRVGAVLGFAVYGVCGHTTGRSYTRFGFGFFPGMTRLSACVGNSLRVRVVFAPTGGRGGRQGSGSTHGMTARHGSEQGRGGATQDAEQVGDSGGGVRQQHFTPHRHYGDNTHTFHTVLHNRPLSRYNARVNQYATKEEVCGYGC